MVSDVNVRGCVVVNKFKVIECFLETGSFEVIINIDNISSIKPDLYGRGILYMNSGEVHYSKRSFSDYKWLFNEDM